MQTPSQRHLNFIVTGSYALAIFGCKINPANEVLQQMKIRDLSAGTGLYCTVGLGTQVKASIILVLYSMSHAYLILSS
jgi:hypothetical protein